MKCNFLGPFTFICEFLIQCMMEGFVFTFQTQPHFSANPGQKNEVFAQVFLSPFMQIDVQKDIIFVARLFHKLAVF